MSEQTATERLRELLDERGVEWSYGGFYHSTYFVVDDVYYSAYEQRGKLYLKTSVGPITPEQAIDATLGRGTCHEAAFCSCSECGAQLDGIYGHYCPNCGRMVVD